MVKQQSPLVVSRSPYVVPSVRAYWYDDFSQAFFISMSMCYFCGASDAIPFYDHSYGS